MESNEVEKGEIERLAEIRAKRRLGSWGEQHKAGWFGGLIFFVWIYRFDVNLVVLEDWRT